MPYCRYILGESGLLRKKSTCPSKLVVNLTSRTLSRSNLLGLEAEEDRFSLVNGEGGSACFLEAKVEGREWSEASRAPLRVVKNRSSSKVSGKGFFSWLSWQAVQPDGLLEKV